jgi:hypothetical protein
MYSRLLAHLPVLSVWFSLLAFCSFSMVVALVVFALIRCLASFLMTSTVLLSSLIFTWFLGVQFFSFMTTR